MLRSPFSVVRLRRDASRADELGDLGLGSGLKRAERSVADFAAVADVLEDVEVEKLSTA